MLNLSEIATRCPTPVRRLVFPDDLFAPERTGKAPADDAVVANARLTASLGSLLILLFAAVGVTLLDVTGLIDWHAGLGVAAGVVVVAKLLSTGYRMVSYYGRSGTYVASGPPHPVMRVLAPFLVLATIAVIGTGLGALYWPTNVWLFFHKASFIGWIALAAVHVLVYVWRLPRVVTAPRGQRRRFIGTPVWTALLFIATVIGAVGVAWWFVRQMPQLPDGAFGHG